MQSRLENLWHGIHHGAQKISFKGSPLPTRLRESLRLGMFLHGSTFQAVLPRYLKPKHPPAPSRTLTARIFPRKPLFAGLLTLTFKLFPVPWMLCLPLFPVNTVMSWKWWTCRQKDHTVGCKAPVCILEWGFEPHRRDAYIESKQTLSYRSRRPSETLIHPRLLNHTERAVDNQTQTHLTLNPGFFQLYHICYQCG